MVSTYWLLIKLFLDHDADVNASDGNLSLLQLACKQANRFVGCLDVVELLLLRGAEPGWHGNLDLSLLSTEQRERMDAAIEMCINPGLK